VWQIGSTNRSRYSVFGTQFSPFGLLDSVSDNDTQNTQAYLGDTWELGRRLTLKLGVRADKMIYHRPNPGAGSLDLHETSGRAGATYLLSPRLLVRTSTGRYVGFPRANLVASQFLPHKSEIPDFADLGLTWDMAFFPFFPVQPEVDRDRDLGFEWKLDESSLLTTTWFRRDSRQMMQRWQGAVEDAEGNLIPSARLSDFDPDAPVWFAANGTGTTRGLELKLDRRMSHRLRGWLSYTLMDAKATSPEDNVYPYGFGFLNRTDAASLAEEFPVDWNQRRTLALALRYQTGKLVVNPWLVIGSGFPYGQSGLDDGGSDPAHVPNPDFNPEDPTSPEELVVPRNYLDPSDPAKGFITPNSLHTGKNLTLSLNLSYQIGPRRQAYVQIFNLFDREDVTSYVIFHPRTGAVLGQISDGAVQYVPFSRTPPRFIAMGIRQEF
jgi:outer membrane receptor protein involved in Fe transport